MSNHEKGSQKMVIPKMYVSYWANPNRYAGKCCLCGAKVERRKGWNWKDRERGWVTACHRCALMNSRSLPEGVSCKSMTARPGQAEQIVSIHRCSKCDARVGLVKSKRGKWYLCGIREGESYYEQRTRTKAMPWVLHQCDVDHRDQHREQYEKEVNAYQGEKA